MVFSGLSCHLKIGDSLAITGRNGSGKTTLLKLIAGLISPTKGRIVFRRDDETLDRTAKRHYLSYVGPELTLYDALTAWENLKFFATMHSAPWEPDKIEAVLNDLEIYDRRFDYYGSYSSGMKQRLKYVVALINDPRLLLLDEPMANLDDQGKLIVEQIILRQKECGIVIIATNEKGEYGLAEKRLQLGD